MPFTGRRGLPSLRFTSHTHVMPRGAEARDWNTVWVYHVGSRNPPTRATPVSSQGHPKLGAAVRSEPRPLDGEMDT